MFSNIGTAKTFTNQKSADEQQKYVRRVEQIVTAMALRLTEAIDQKSDLQALFHEELRLAGQNRRAIAIEHNTNGAEHFGVRRDEGAGFGFCAITSLHSPYEAYNDRLLTRIQALLGPMRHSLTRFDQTALTLPGETCLGRKTSMDIDIMTYEKCVANNVTVNLDYYCKLCQLCAVDPSENSDISEALTQLSKNQQAMWQLKRASLDDYKQFKLHSIIRECRNTYPDKRKSDWVVITTRAEVDGKLYALSQYLTWMNRDFRTDPVLNMKGNSTVTLMHQDVFLITIMLNDCAKLFKQTLEWDGQDKDALMATVALLQFEYTHAMPYRRGSAAIGEWLEMAIYRHHGFNLSYQETRSVNLEALILPLKTFVDQYPAMIELTPIAPRLGFTLR